MEIERLCGVDLMGWRRIGEERGTPWKEDWWVSKKEVLGLEEREEVRVVAIVAMEGKGREGKGVLWSEV